MILPATTQQHPTPRSSQNIPPPSTHHIPAPIRTSNSPSSLWFELLNFDVFAVMLAILVYCYLIVGCSGYQGQLTLSSVSVLFGGPGGAVVPQIIAAQVTDNSLIKHLWINVDPAQCLSTIAQRHNVNLQLDTSIQSSPLLDLENLNQSHYGQCSAICASTTFAPDCAVHYLVPAKILDQHLPVLLLNANSSFVSMSDYFVLFQDTLQEYRATSGSGSVDIVQHPVTTVSSAFFGKSSFVQCNNKPCLIFDSYTSVAPRAHNATTGEVVLGYSVPCTTNEKYRATCANSFAPAENKHRAEIGLTQLTATSSCQTIDVTAGEGTSFMTAYSTDYLGDQVLLDASNRRVLIEPSHQVSTLELVTITTMMEIGWLGWQHSHILRDEDLQFVTKRVDNAVMIQSSMVPQFAAIVVQLAVYYFITYKFVLHGVRHNPATHVGLSDLRCRSSMDYWFLIQSAAGCMSATGVLAWIGPVYQQLIPWGATAPERRPLHALTMLSLLQYYVTAVCARSVIRRNLARRVIRTRSYALVQDTVVRIVAFLAVTIGFVMTLCGKYIAPRHEDDEMNTSRINISIVVGVNIFPHVIVEILTRVIAVEMKAKRSMRSLSTFEAHCVGTRIESLVPVIRLRWKKMDPTDVQSCIMFTYGNQVFVRREVVVLLGYVYVAGGIVRMRDLLSTILIISGLREHGHVSVTMWRTRALDPASDRSHNLEIEHVCHYFRSWQEYSHRIVGDIGGTATLE